MVVIAGLVGFALGITLTVAAVYFLAPRLMLVHERSTRGYRETLTTLHEQALAQGWTVPTVHELDVMIGKFGYQTHPAAVMEMCKPALASRVLDDDQARAVAAMMPCRVAVYETRSGDVIVTRMNTALLSRVFGGVVTEVMTRATRESDRVVAPVTGRPQ